MMGATTWWLFGQAASEAGPAPWWQVLVNNALALTLLVIFLTAIFVALLNAWRRDKCLKLLHDYHVTYLTTDGRPTWGDLVVCSRGIELRFDAPYRTRRGTTKSSSLIYEDEMERLLALCRLDTALTDAERRRRRRQVTRTFKPGPIRRSLRALRNTANTLRDAIAKSINTVLGQLAKTKPSLAAGKGEVEQLGQTLLGVVQRAYEPLLERHLGRPVVLEVSVPGAGDDKPVELPGYLVDYTERYIAVFNVEHQIEESLNVEVSGPLQRPGFQVEPAADEVTIAATGPDPIVIRRATLGGRQYDLDVVLLPGCRLTLARHSTGPVALTIERTRQLDVVCPRSLARVHFGSDQPPSGQQRAGWRGLAPWLAAGRND